MSAKEKTVSLSKEVCQKCHSKNPELGTGKDSWNAMDERMWPKGYVVCEPGRIAETKEVPSWCVYNLEHMVSEGGEDSEK